MREKKWILVTGGSRGIGAAVVEQCARDGFNVAFTTRTSTESQSSRCQLLAEEYGIQARAIRCDLTLEDDVDHLIEALRENKINAYGLIHNAFEAYDRLLLQIELAEARGLMQLGVWSFVKLLQEDR